MTGSASAAVSALQNVPDKQKRDITISDAE